MRKPSDPLLQASRAFQAGLAAGPGAGAGTVAGAGAAADPDDPELWELRVREAPRGDEPDEPIPGPFAGDPDAAGDWLPELDGYSRDPGSVSGTSREVGPDLSCGGRDDRLRPGRVLAAVSAEAFEAGLGSLTDDELAGMLRASRRLAAWQDGIELAAVAELDARRMRDAERPGWSRASEHVSEELAAALILTSRSADSLLTLARDLAKLPQVLSALIEGRIDRARAAVFAAELSALDGRVGKAVAMGFAGIAGQMTTSQLRAALRAMVLALDPRGARKRAEKARADARVEAWQETSGNGALAGRELSAADAIAADRRITAIARALADAGAPGTMDQLRAAVFAALLAGRDLESLYPEAGTAQPGTAQPGTARPGNTQPGPASRRGNSDGPGQSAGPGQSGGPGQPGGPGKPGGSGKPGSLGQSGGPGQPGGLAGLTGTVILTLPAATWLGWSDAPGEAAGLGPLDAWTCRDLVSRLQQNPAARWQLVLTDPAGRAVACARARHGPGPPGGAPASRLGWLASLKPDWLERGTCAHPRVIRGYRPGGPLANLVRARQRTCCFPGCRRPAADCDLDHTIAWQDGGLTCECNLASLCRRHHRAKQAPGWHLAQPEPGVLTWTAPHGRRYTAVTEPYPV